MKNKKIILPLLVLGMFSVGTATVSAHTLMKGDFKRNDVDLEVMFQKQATLFGIDIIEVKNAWAENKDIFTLAKEKGIDVTALKTKLETERKTQFEAQLQSKVTKGELTQAQVDQIKKDNDLRKTEIDTQMAQVLGITLTELQTYQNTGKDINTIITEKGLHKDIVFANLKKMKDENLLKKQTTQVQALVTKGVITQAQADKKIETFKTRISTQTTNTDKLEKFGGKGGFPGFGF